MVHIKKFEELNERVFADWVDPELIQGVIDNMNPRKTKEGFIEELMRFNDQFLISGSQKRLPSVFGRQVADWVDLNVIQDVIDRMNPTLNKDHEIYKKRLKDLISNVY